MAKETERRFLVHKNRLPKLSRGKKITQGYLSSDPVVRIRMKEKRFYLTIKFGDSIVRDEFEYKIPSRDGLELLDRCPTKVEKTRFNFKLNGFTWEIDIFEGKNSGLIVAEIEIDSLKVSIPKPLWISKEVTQDLRYLNSNLAKKPFEVW